MRIGVWLVSGVLLATAPCQAADENDHYLAYEFSCASYNDALRTGDPDPAIYEWYLRGWLTRYDQKTTRTFALFTSLKEATQALTDYCAQNVDKKSNAAMDDIAERVFERRLKNQKEYSLSLNRVRQNEQAQKQAAQLQNTQSQPGLPLLDDARPLSSNNVSRSTFLPSNSLPDNK